MVRRLPTVVPFAIATTAAYAAGAISGVIAIGLAAGVIALFATRPLSWAWTSKASTWPSWADDAVSWAIGIGALPFLLGQPLLEHSDGAGWRAAAVAGLVTLAPMLPRAPEPGPADHAAPLDEAPGAVQREFRNL
jgi:hypothetical protein